jgi:hypothetical protein
MGASGHRFPDLLLSSRLSRLSGAAQICPFREKSRSRVGKCPPARAHGILILYSSVWVRLRCVAGGSLVRSPLRLLDLFEF